MLRPAVTALTVLPALLLSGCGDDPEPRADTERKTTCRTEGTVASNPSPTMRAAVAPFLRDGERFALERQVTDTATVLLVAGDGAVGARVTLVKAAGGWAPTSVERCRPR